MAYGDEGQSDVPSKLGLNRRNHVHIFLNLDEYKMHAL